MKLDTKSEFLLDSHVHLQDTRFKCDLAEVIARAESDGVGRFLCNSQRPDDWDELLRLAENWPNSMTPYFGVHPWQLAAAPDDWEERLEAILERSERFVPGVGEIGLDKAVTGRNPMKLQETYFRKQLAIAKRKELPISLHLVGTMNRALDILSAEGPFKEILLHGYGGQMERIGDWIRLNTFFSFSPDVLDEENHQLRAAAKHLPFERIRFESDAPYRPLKPDKCPANWRIIDGKPRTEPMIVARIRKEIAFLRQIPPEAL